MCGYGCDWEHCWFDDDEGSLGYTDMVQWWWYISKERQVADPTQVIWKSQHEE